MLKCFHLFIAQIDEPSQVGIGKYAGGHSTLLSAKWSY